MFFNKIELIQLPVLEEIDKKKTIYYLFLNITHQVTLADIQITRTFYDYTNYICMKEKYISKH